MLGVMIGLTMVFLAQQINLKIYDYSPGKSAKAKRFQEGFGRFSSLLLIIGLAQAGGGIVLTVLAFRAGSGSKDFSRDDFSELFSLFNQQIKPDEPPNAVVQRLRESINKVNLDLVEARKRERAVVERAVDVICIIDIESKFVSVSKASKSAWGYEPQELEKRPLLDILVSDKADSILGSILGSANSIDKIVFECKLKKKNGDLMDVVWTGHWSASDSGLFCIVHDITERKKAEEIVKRSEERLRLTLEGLPAGVIISNQKGVVEFANSEAAQLFSCQLTDLIGQQVSNVIYDRKLDPTDLPQKDLTQAERIQGRARRKDQSTFPVEISENKIDLSGEQKTIAVFLDKTAQEELERLKTEFIAMITHDLKTPLTSIHGILALLEEGVLGQLSDHGREMTKRVKATCKRLLRLINDLLDLEKINAGMFKLECVEVNAGAVIEHALENVKPIADERQISFHVSGNGHSCWGDEDRLVQVMVNLLSNAIKYSPDSSSIKINAEDAGESVRFSVSDQGRGIPEDKVGKVFNKFEQVEISDAKKKGGTGLGLAICQAIVQEHHGEIGVESKFGEGSSFWFSIPKISKGEV